MKTYIYKAWIIAVVAMICSCESYLINGNLDGFWQVQTIENKQTGEITHCEGDVYYSFQRDLVLLTYILPHRPTGPIKEHHIAYFTQENDSIAMTDFRIYLDKEATQTPLEKLAKFGLYDLFTTFQLEELNKKSLILTSDKARITMRKY